MPRTLVGLTGYAGSGKDTIAQVLVERDGWKRLAFADDIRTAALIIDPIVDGYGGPLSSLISAYGWDDAKRTYPDVRRLLQSIGDAGRYLEPNIWFDRVFNAIASESVDQPIVVTDVRYEEESATTIRSFGGTMVRIDRPGIGPANGHSTEMAVNTIQVDFEIVNDRTPEWAADLLLERLADTSGVVH